MRFLAPLLLLQIQCFTVYADSIHAQKIVLFNGIPNVRDAENELRTKEIKEFIQSRCPVKKTVRISAQAISSNPKKAKEADLVRLRLVEEIGLPENQIFTMPGGGISADYLRRNDLLDSLPKAKNPVVVEVFC